MRIEELFIPKMTESIEEETIQIRRQTKLKLPDAIIAATAIMLNAELVTTDEHFLGCKYPKLQVMAVA
ncbi:hypothetical protein AGMMS50212_06790 [Spirochaetia bacterium]|nr:hypothetical protein AGMMS50212_06790 [Spirochaetia bacterium]